MVCYSTCLPNLGDCKLGGLLAAGRDCPACGELYREAVVGEVKIAIIGVHFVEESF